jgi:hypothetical protein
MSIMPTFPDAANFFPAHAGKIAETQRTQAMIDGAKNDITQPGEVLAVVTILFDPVAAGESAAVDPEHHRPLLAVIHRGREHVDAEAILADIVVVPVIAEGCELIRITVLHVLRSGVAPPERRVHLGPWLGFLRRHEPVCPRGVRAIGHAQEVIDAPKLVSSDLSVLSIRQRNIVADQQNLPILGFRHRVFRKCAHCRCANGNPG